MNLWHTIRWQVDLQAYGTSEGAEKAWDTRGRGHKQSGSRYDDPIYTRGWVSKDGVYYPITYRNDHETIAEKNGWGSVSDAIDRGHVRVETDTLNPYFSRIAFLELRDTPDADDKIRDVVSRLPENVERIGVERVHSPYAGLAGSDYEEYRRDDLFGNAAGGPTLLHNVRSYGTSEGVEKAWDTRGRGRKQETVGEPLGHSDQLRGWITKQGRWVSVPIDKNHEEVMHDHYLNLGQGGTYMGGLLNGHIHVENTAEEVAYMSRRSGSLYHRENAQVYRVGELTPQKTALIIRHLEGLPDEAADQWSVVTSPAFGGEHEVASSSRRRGLLAQLGADIAAYSIPADLPRRKHKIRIPDDGFPTVRPTQEELKRRGYKQAMKQIYPHVPLLTPPGAQPLQTITGDALVEEIKAVIRRRGKQFCVQSEDLTKSFGCYETLQKARERMRQIEYFKRQAS